MVTTACIQNLIQVKERKKDMVTHSLPAELQSVEINFVGEAREVMQKH